MRMVAVSTLFAVFLAHASVGCVSVQHAQFDGKITDQNGTEVSYQASPIDGEGGYGLLRLFHIYRVGSIILHLSKPAASTDAHQSSTPNVSEMYFVKHGEWPHEIDLHDFLLTDEPTMEKIKRLKAYRPG